MVQHSSCFQLVRENRKNRILFKAVFYGESAYVTLQSESEGCVLMVWGHLSSFIKKLERGGQEGEDGGGAGGGSGKCELIGSERILMFTAAFGEQHLAHIWY